jgi:hypothetical protein
MVSKLALREFSEVHIDEDCRSIRGGHENGLFFNCDFDRLSDVTLKNCVLTNSRFNASSIRDVLGFTVTLDCNSFVDVELSPEIFDLLLTLLTATKGNDAKREKLLDVIGRHKAERLRTLLKQTE